MEEKDKFFIKNCKIKLKDSVLLVLNSNDDYENNFNQLKTYYMFLIKSKTISNNNNDNKTGSAGPWAAVGARTPCAASTRWRSRPRGRAGPGIHIFSQVLYSDFI